MVQLVLLMMDTSDLWGLEDCVQHVLLFPVAGPHIEINITVMFSWCGLGVLCLFLPIPSQRKTHKNTNKETERLQTPLIHSIKPQREMIHKVTCAAVSHYMPSSCVQKRVFQELSLFCSISSFQRWSGTVSVAPVGCWLAYQNNECRKEKGKMCTSSLKNKQ